MATEHSRGLTLTLTPTLSLPLTPTLSLTLTHRFATLMAYASIGKESDMVGDNGTTTKVSQTDGNEGQKE